MARRAHLVEHTPERVARVIATARCFGRHEAAKLHKVSVTTVDRYRDERAEHPLVAPLVERYIREITDEWVLTARASLSELLRIQLRLARKPSAKLPSVTNAIRRTVEVVMTHDALHDPTNAVRDDDHQPATARAAEGADVPPREREGG